MTKEEIIKSLKKRYSEYKKSCVKLNISDLTTNSINSYWGGKPLVDNDFI